MLAEGHVSQAVAELWRLAELGSGPAAALLDYLSLVGLDTGQIDAAAVEARCREAATRGDSFAQYVVAWRQYAEGKYPDALDWLGRSVTQRFAPAIGDVGRFFANGTGMSQRRPNFARAALCHAIRRGHLPSLILLLLYCRKGLFGAWWQIPGALAHPIAVLLSMPVIYLFPFELSTFAHSLSDKRPPFAEKENKYRRAQ